MISLPEKFFQRKKKPAKLYTLPNILSDITYAFHDKKIINLISEITKINNLYADENLYAGGLSIMSKNDFLNPHIDNSHDIHRRHYRRLNLLYYVAKDWNINDGGNLELWNTKVSIQKTIFSKFNRLVVMNTDRKSWHSVSKVLSQKIVTVSQNIISHLIALNLKKNIFMSLHLQEGRMSYQKELLAT